MAALERDASDRPFEIDHVDRLAVRDALTVLSEHERQVVILTYWDQLSAGEIAETLRCSQGSVWTALSRARTKLRGRLGMGDGGDGDE